AHIVNAVSGLMHLEQGDEPAPRASNLQAADVLAGTHAAVAILGALTRKARTGQGAHLDVSMLEALVAADSVTYAAVLNGGEEYGNPRPGMIVAPIGDRYLAMQFTGSGELWPRLLAAMGRPELGRDPRFDTSEKRRANWRELRPIVESWLAAFASVEDARKALSDARIPCAPVLRPAEVIAEPHMAARQFFPDVPHPGRGTVRVTASPYHIDGLPVHPRGPAAYRVGEHTRVVLGDLLGYPAARIAELARSGVICAPALTGPSITTTTPNGTSEQIPVELSKPEGPGPFPAVVIMHDCSGLGPRSSGAPGRWVKELVGRGYVVIMPDSFTTRGFPDGVCTDGSRSRDDVSPARRGRDAYAALAYLRALPYVDGAH